MKTSIAVLLVLLFPTSASMATEREDGPPASIPTSTPTIRFKMRFTGVSRTNPGFLERDSRNIEVPGGKRYLKAQWHHDFDGGEYPKNVLGAVVWTGTADGTMEIIDTRILEVAENATYTGDAIVDESQLHAHYKFPSTRSHVLNVSIDRKRNVPLYSYADWSSTVTAVATYFEPMGNPVFAGTVTRSGFGGSGTWQIESDGSWETGHVVIPPPSSPRWT